MSADTALDRATALQRQAADPDFSAWVSANAGAGKTRVLIDRISRLLLGGVQAGKILCLTFTKAAAAEMENRLSDRLGEWAVMDDAALGKALFTLLGAQPDSDDLIRARRLFAETLEAPGGFKIRTIHAFCESLLGRFPIEANIAPHSAVMDDRTAKETLEESRARVYARAFADDKGPLAAALDAMAGLIDEGTFDDVMRELLFKRSRFKRALSATGGVDGLNRAIARRLGVEPEETPDSVVRAGIMDSAFDRDGLHAAIQAMKDGKPTDKKNAQTLETWLSGNEATRRALLDGAYRSLFLSQKDGQPKVQKSMITKGPSELSPAAVDSLFAEQARIFKLSEYLKAVVVADGTRSLITLAVALIDAYEDLKQARAQLDYDDLILKARALLARDNGIGWVHFKLDGGIDHVLVDEAQDTSPEQWQVIIHLVSEFFSGEGAYEAAGGRDDQPGPLPARTVFAVGDMKQSIFSFQGADPEVFAQMRDFFAMKAGNKLRPVTLEQSFRSTSAVLDVVDAVFARSVAQPGVSDENGTHHIAQRRDHAGLVHLLPAITKSEREDPGPWDAPVDRVREASPMARTAENIVTTIDHWLKSGERLDSRDREIEPGDIMILLRKRGQIADEIVRRLKSKGIPVAGSDRMVLTDQIAVMDLIAAARFALLPEDNLNLATVLKGPFVGISEEDLFLLAHNRTETLWRSLIAHAKQGNKMALQAHEILSRLMAHADFVPPYEFFARLLNAERGRAALIARLGEEINDPIDEFLGQAFIFEREHPASLQGFLAWIGAASTEIKRDMEAGRGQVRVMTVHGSKGLEANVVILPDTCAAPNGQMSDKILWSGLTDKDADDPADDALSLSLPFWPGTRKNETGICLDLREQVLAKELEEYRRLLYVAMTRARDRLYIAGWERKNRSESAEHGRDENSWYELILPALSAMDGVSRQETPNGALFSRATSQQTGPIPEDATAEPVSATPAPPDWLSTPPAPEPEPFQPLSPSRPDGEEPPVMPPFSDNDTTRFRRGNLIHRLLQTLPDLPPAQRLGAARNWLRQTATELDTTAREAIATETLSVLEASEFTDIFGPDSLPEVPIAGTVETALGPRTIAGQVDRLLVSADTVTIVDYKTNRPPPQHESDVPEVYLRQMALYKSALEHIYPERAIRCLLVWTDGPTGMVLENDRLDAYTP